MSKKETNYESALIEKLINESDPREYSRTKNRMLIAAKIHDALKAKGWIKKDLAAALNKKPSVITLWLSGTHNFTSDTLTDIGEVLGVSLLNTENKPQEIIERYQFFICQPRSSKQEEENDVGVSIDQAGIPSMNESFKLDAYLT